MGSGLAATRRTVRQDGPSLKGPALYLVLWWDVRHFAPEAMFTALAHSGPKISLEKGERSVRVLPLTVSMHTPQATSAGRKSTHCFARAVS